VLPLWEAMESIWNTLASFNLWQWQYTIISGTHEHCKAADVIGSRKTTLIPMIQICPSDPTIPFKLCRRQFLISTAFAMTISTAQVQMPNQVGIYSPFYAFSHGQPYVTLSWSSSFDNAYVAVIKRHQKYTKNDRYTTTNILYQEVL